MSDQPPQQVEPGQLVQEDRPCLVCGYSLQGLASDSNCPECGTPVDRSLRGPLLRYSSPEYLHTLHRGIVYAEVGTALRLGCSVGFFVIQYGVVGYGPMGLGQQMMIEVAQGLITAIMLVGWWMFTTPDPGAGGSEPGVQARRWTRAMVVVMGGLEVLLAAFSFLPVVRTTAVAAAGGGGFGAQLVFMAARSLLEWGVSVGGVIALGCYLRALAARVPDQTLRQRATLYRWLIPLLLGLGIVPWFFCCGVPLLPRVAGIVLFFVMIEPWRSKLKAIRKTMEAESPPAVQG
jgi:hypothetical protein